MIWIECITGGWCLCWTRVEQQFIADNLTTQNRGQVGRTGEDWQHIPCVKIPTVDIWHHVGWFMHKEPEWQVYQPKIQFCYVWWTQAQDNTMLWFLLMFLTCASIMLLFCLTRKRCAIESHHKQIMKHMCTPVHTQMNTYNDTQCCSKFPKMCLPNQTAGIWKNNKTALFLILQPESLKWTTEKKIGSLMAAKTILRKAAQKVNTTGYLGRNTQTMWTRLLGIQHKIFRKSNDKSCISIPLSISAFDLPVAFDDSANFFNIMMSHIETKTMHKICTRRVKNGMKIISHSDFVTSTKGKHNLLGIFECKNFNMNETPINIQIQNTHVSHLEAYFASLKLEFNGFNITIILLKDRNKCKLSIDKQWTRIKQNNSLQVKLAFQVFTCNIKSFPNLESDINWIQKETITSTWELGNDPTIMWYGLTFFAWTTDLYINLPSSVFNTKLTIIPHIMNIFSPLYPSNLKHFVCQGRPCMHFWKWEATQHNAILSETITCTESTSPANIAMFSPVNELLATKTAIKCAERWKRFLWIENKLLLSKCKTRRNFWSEKVFILSSWITLYWRNNKWRWYICSRQKLILEILLKDKSKEKSDPELQIWCGISDNKLCEKFTLMAFVFNMMFVDKFDLQWIMWKETNGRAPTVKLHKTLLHSIA